MTLPAALIGILLSSLYGLLFHFWKGGSLGRLLLYLGLSWVGFLAGHLLGNGWNWDWAMVGPLQAGAGTLGSLLLLFTGHWLSLVEFTRKE